MVVLREQKIWNDESMKTSANTLGINTQILFTKNLGKLKILLKKFTKRPHSATINKLSAPKQNQVWTGFSIKMDKFQCGLYFKPIRRSAS